MGNTGGADGSGAHGTGRAHPWRAGPTHVILGLLGWVLYAFWAALRVEHYAVGPYVSPFHVPLLWAIPDVVELGGVGGRRALLGSLPAWWPSALPTSPAFAIFLLPVVFRTTCRYYQEAWQRAFADGKQACGESSVSLNDNASLGLDRVQRIHRYTLYLAILLLPFLYYDASMSYLHDGVLGVGLGSILITLNVVFFTSYTLGCHAWRHLFGGRLRCFSCRVGAHPEQGGRGWFAWFQSRHALFAWLSLGWVVGTDLYIRLLSMGGWAEPNTWSGF